MKPNYKHLCSSVDWQSLDGIMVTVAMGQLHKKIQFLPVSQKLRQ